MMKTLFVLSLSPPTSPARRREPTPAAVEARPPEHAARARLGGALVLSAVTLLWGTTFVFTRDLETGPDHHIRPSVLTLFRFLLAAAVCTPWLVREGRNWRLWAAGAELGFWLWCGYASQAVGLATTTVGRSAFITSLNVVFVPALAALAGTRIRARLWAAAILALGGTALLCYDGALPNRGDAWTLATAVTFAVYIIRVERYAGKFPSIPQTAVQLWTVALLSAVWVLTASRLGFERGPVVGDWMRRMGPVWAQLVYLGVVTTALTTWLQAVGQRTVPAMQASLLYTLEPVWASVCAWLAYRERFGPRGWVGASLILVAAVWSLWPRCATVVTCGPEDRMTIGNDL